MLAAFFAGGRQLELREVPDPEPGPGEARVRVEAATICGTDLHILAGEFKARPPVVLGHEFAGRVDRLGAGVAAVREGELVTIEPHKFCRVCKYCKTGREHLCLDKRAYGVHYNGGFAQYAVVPENTLYPVPPGVTAREAALTEVLACCLRGIDQARIRAGDTVAILGCSSVGMIFTKLARHAGAAKVIVSEPSPERRRAALGYGADLAVGPEELREALAAATGGLGPEILIEASGAPAAQAQSLELSGKASTVLLFGISPPGRTIPLDPNLVVMKELTIVGSNINPFTHHRAVEMLPVLKLGGLVTHAFPLERINEALETAARGEGLKIAVEPNG